MRPTLWPKCPTNHLNPRLCVQATGADELTRLVKEEGYKGVRFNPYLWPDGEPMTNAIGMEMYKRCFPPLLGPALSQTRQPLLLKISGSIPRAPLGFEHNCTRGHLA